MARVLISFLGTSDYKSVKYRFPILKKDVNGIETECFNDTSEQNNIETELFFTALKKRCNIDRVYLIGTIRSNWAKVFDDLFNALSNEQKPQYDWDTNCISNEILEKTYYNTNYDAELNFPHKEKIEQLLGKGSKIILINYGITQAEIKSNSEKVLGLDFSSEDEVYVDITHGFRSLPMSIMNTLIYLKYVKSVTIESIFYGLMDNESFEDFVPVVDLKSLIDTSDWIMGAYAFKEFGKGYKIAELLKNGDKDDKINKESINKTDTLLEKNKNVDNDAINKINNFSDSMNLNLMSNIKNNAKALQTIKKQVKNPFAKHILPSIISEFENKFTNKDSNQSSTKDSEDDKKDSEDDNFKSLLAITRWHFDHTNFSSAYITIVQCIITYVCKKCSGFNEYIDTIEQYKNEGKDFLSQKTDEQIKDFYKSKVNIQKEECAKQVLDDSSKKRITDKNDLAEYKKKVTEYDSVQLVYKNVNSIRNNIAHVNYKNSNNSKYLANLEDCLQRLKNPNYNKSKTPQIRLLNPNTNITEIKILDVSIQILERVMK